MTKWDDYSREEGTRRIYLASDGGMPPTPEVMRVDDLIIKVRRLELQMHRLLEFRESVWKVIEIHEKFLDEKFPRWDETDLDRMIREEE